MHSNLDVLRAVAVLSVVGSHLLRQFGVAGIGAITEWEIGRIGVLMFFVHTSLVLMYSMERMPLQWSDVLTFYTRRAFRIYPLAIVCVLAVLLLRIPGMPWHAPETPTIAQILSNLTLTQNLFYQGDLQGPLWSLPVEVQMYLMLPLLYFAVRRFGLRGVAVAGIAAVLLGAIVEARGMARLSMLTFAPCFVSGVLAYALEKRLTRIAPAWLWTVALAAAPVLFLGRRNKLASGGWLFCAALGAAIPLFRDLSARWISVPAQTIAKYSYGIYLAHCPVIWLAFVLLKDQPMPVQWVTFALGVSAVPVACFHWIESPMIAFGIRLPGLWLHKVASVRTWTPGSTVASK